MKLHPWFRHLPAQAVFPHSQPLTAIMKMTGFVLALSTPILTADITGDFAKPPPMYRPTPLYWLNGKITNEVIDSQLTRI